MAALAIGITMCLYHGTGTVEPHYLITIPCLPAPPLAMTVIMRFVGRWRATHCDSHYQHYSLIARPPFSLLLTGACYRYQVTRPLPSRTSLYQVTRPLPSTMSASLYFPTLDAPSLTISYPSLLQPSHNLPIRAFLGVNIAAE